MSDIFAKLAAYKNNENKKNVDAVLIGGFKYVLVHAFAHVRE